MRTQTFGPIRQIAWVVHDLEASVANWLRVSGVGPWTCFRNVAMTGVLRVPQPRCACTWHSATRAIWRSS